MSNSTGVVQHPPATSGSATIASTPMQQEHPAVLAAAQRLRTASDYEGAFEALITDPNTPTPVFAFLRRVLADAESVSQLWAVA